MIKNIVFDMGKVLIYYESMRACRHFIDNEADQKAVCAAVFDSPEWVLLDMGVISEEELTIASSLNTLMLSNNI